jgi:GNAT superfamily N-acetyltransferase
MRSNLNDWNLREMERRDMPTFARFLSQHRREERTPEQIERDDAAWIPELQRRIVACDREGAVWGIATVQRYRSFEPVLFALWVYVDPLERGRGLGASLYSEATSWAEACGATHFKSEVDERDRLSFSFMQKRRFEQKRHLFESVLNLETCEPREEGESKRRLEEQGIKIASLAELGDTEQAFRGLHELNALTASDVPGGDSFGFPDFEEFSAGARGSDWFDPCGQIGALQGDLWVGLCAVGEVAPGAYYNLHTGVRRGFRGLGIAKALKLESIAYAQERGGKTIRTNNDSCNLPMLAINRKLGYQPEPGWYLMENVLTGSKSCNSPIPGT